MAMGVMMAYESRKAEEYAQWLAFAQAVVSAAAMLPIIAISPTSIYISFALFAFSLSLPLSILRGIIAKSGILPSVTLGVTRLILIIIGSIAHIATFLGFTFILFHYSEFQGWFFFCVSAFSLVLCLFFLQLHQKSKKRQGHLDSHHVNTKYKECNGA